MTTSIEFDMNDTTVTKLLKSFQTFVSEDISMIYLFQVVLSVDI